MGLNIVGLYRENEKQFNRKSDAQSCFDAVYNWAAEQAVSPSHVSHNHVSFQPCLIQSSYPRNNVFYVSGAEHIDHFQRTGA